MNNIFKENSKNILCRTLYRAGKEAAILFLIAPTLALVFNWARPSYLPLFGFSSAKLVKERQANIQEITLGEAHDLFLKKKSVFVDARDPLSFAEGHIAGAVNIYPDEVELHLPKLREQLAPDSIVITYCDGPQCPLSKETAQALLLQGLPGVKVLVNGWSLWLQAGYPVRKGQI